MSPEQLTQLKKLSESFQTGKADTKTIRELSQIIEKLQSDRNVEVNYNQQPNDGAH